ncbi:NAD(P)H-dependent oxidoreductase [Mycolicibacterium iranicum]|uniref:NAD(P)H-dependent oxidoreductase n=1 Tax=Mycolicibacterium iranicum TaxID=912594 RepID=UPI0037C65567
MKVLILSASPRDDGNSHTLALAAGDGARKAGSAGSEVEHLFLDDYVDRDAPQLRTT